MIEEAKEMKNTGKECILKTSNKRLYEVFKCIGFIVDPRKYFRLGSSLI